MKVSVIIPTINRYDDLLKTVGFLEDQCYDSYEIIIIDQTESPQIGIIEKLKSKANLQYVRSETKSASAARNTGIKLSDGEIVLFLDDDVIIKDRNFLSKHARHYADPLVPGVYGCPLELTNAQKKQYTRPPISYLNLHFSWLYFPSNFGSAAWVAVGRSNNLSVRRHLAIEAGGMDENYEKGAHREEGDFCLRVFQKYGPFLFDPMASLVHIGNRQGGIRSWNDNAFVKAKHNIVGAIYFDIKMAPPKFSVFYYFATLRYFILNATILKRPKLWYLAVSRIFSSYMDAKKLLKSGPKYIND